MASIELNFRMAKQQADQLENLALQLDRLASSQFSGTMQVLSANWKGENANAFLQKGSRLENDMRQTAKNMQKAAVQIRTAAKKIYDAEMYAKRLAEKRAYGNGRGNGGGGGAW